MNREEIEIQDEGEFYLEPYSPHENIAAAFNALAAVDTMDDGLMKPVDKNRVRQIKRKALLILHRCVGEIYDMVFEENENPDDEI